MVYVKHEGAPLEASLETRNTALSGAIAGLAGGIAMGLFAMIYSAATGLGFFTPLRWIAATFYGAEVLEGGVVPIFVGFLLHVIVSIFWGVVFGFLARRVLTLGTGMMIGAGFGLIVWAAMTFVALPVFNPMMRDMVALMPGAWLFQHLIYGLGCGLFPAIRENAGGPHMQSPNVTPPI